jgi:hypothetical protein
MSITRTVLSLILFGGGSVVPSFAERITPRQLMASSVTDVRDVSTFNVNVEVSPATSERRSETLEDAMGQEAVQPVSATGSSRMRTAIARIPEPVSLALMGTGTVVLAAYVARRKRRYSGRLWDRRRSPRRGYY